MGLALPAAKQSQIAVSKLETNRVTQPYYLTLFCFHKLAQYERVALSGPTLDLKQEDQLAGQQLPPKVESARATNVTGVLNGNPNCKSGWGAVKCKL